jgi:uncharacterized protein YoxC
METWVAVFVIVAAVAIVLQVVILSLLFFELRRAIKSVDNFVGDLRQRLTPILARTELLLAEAEPKIVELISDAAHVVYLARGQAQKVDRVFTEAADRLRGQLVRVDHILTGALEAVEDAGSRFQRNLWRPVQKVSALVEGVRVGLDLLRSRRSRRSSSDERVEREEELFI